MKLIASVLVCGALLACAAHAQSPTPAATVVEPERWALHWQVTNVTQWHAPFRSRYSGENSLATRGRAEETSDVTLYAGMALWRGAELWLNPEIDQGFGLSNTLGLAGFSSGEAYKVGSNTPYPRLPRAFVRHVIALGADTEQVEAGANQLAGARTANNLTLTVGKFSVVDIFDTNAYAHDPRADFLNWSIIDSGAFDYAADAWGFTYGAAAEWAQDFWTLRGGLFQLSRVPNGKVTGVDLHQYMLVTEIEGRLRWRERPGKVKLLAFVNHGRMALYRDAVRLAQESGGVADVALVRRNANRPGIALIFEQEVAEDLGVFARASANEGSKEAYEFTEINRSLAGGLALKGRRWGRPEDTFGVAGVVNGLSREARAYFAAGGMGILIGDGALGYKPERIAETYYAMRLHPRVTITFNYQRVVDPAHNADRGPVNVYAFRFHGEL